MRYLPSHRAEGFAAEYNQYHNYPYYLLQKEQKPNGLDVVYTHDKDWRLTGIKSQNRHGTNLAAFTCDIQKESLKLRPVITGGSLISLKS